MIVSPRAGPPRALLEPILAAALAACAAALVVGLVPLDGDAPAHLYRTLLVRHGIHVWDNFWFAGDYPLASYSALYYLPAALVGNVPFVIAAVLVAAALFASLAIREWGERARWAARVFALVAAGSLVTGTYAYAVGFALLIGALRAVQARKTWLAVFLSALTLAFSPLAFVFLVLALLAVAVARRRAGRKALAVAIAIAALGGFELVALAVFPENSIYPGSAWDLLGVLVVSALAVLLAARAERGELLVSFFALWAVASVSAYFVPSPIGDNVTRLRYVIFPLVLLAATLARFRPRWLAGAAIACALAYNVVPYLAEIPLHDDHRPAEQAFWAPVVGYLQTHLGSDFRVEVVPTSEHWEAYWVASAGIPLARGWYRQIDYADNRLLYGTLTPGAYRAWLRTLGIRYVVLPRTKLDPLGSAGEARLLRSGRSGLVQVFETTSAVVYELPRATPILTPSRTGAVTRLGHETIAGFARRPGTYTLRVRYTPYWRVATGDLCVSALASGMTRLRVTAPGRFTLVLPEEAEAILSAFLSDRTSTCGT